MKTTNKTGGSMNKKGFVHYMSLIRILGMGGAIKGGSALATVTAFKLAWIAIAMACIWHIPAWSQAKAQGGDAPAIYQAQEMFPQQLFDKLPGGHDRTGITFIKGNGGVLPGGNYTP